jgi:uncharacterized membrane protein
MRQEKKVSGRIELQRQHLYSGPIPDPESLSRYEQIQPGFAERIMSMAEQEAIHRRTNEKNIIKSASKMSYLGIIFAFVTVLFFCGLIFYAITKEQNMTALSLAIGAVASLAGIFMFFRKKQVK